jgi:hypothetical protein
MCEFSLAAMKSQPNGVAYLLFSISQPTPPDSVKPLPKSAVGYYTVGCKTSLNHQRDIPALPEPENQYFVKMLASAARVRELPENQKIGVLVKEGKVYLIREGFIPHKESPHAVPGTMWQLPGSYGVIDILNEAKRCEYQKKVTIVIELGHPHMTIGSVITLEDTFCNVIFRALDNPLESRVH